MMSWSAKCSWNAETPGRVPAGARISAGKSGSVDRSLPNDAVDAGEPVAGELHAVAGVPGEADDHTVELDYLLAHSTLPRAAGRPALNFSVS